ncbi:MAG: FtsX-like permease family protein [Alphaproteobacteria bacterium]|nr:FtsX-like permease family protein [Alphaproteobacteria bacterium]
MNGIGVVLATLLSHWRRSPWQAALLITGLASATALLSGVLALNHHARINYDVAARQIGGVALGRLEAPSSAPFSQAAFADLRRRGARVSPVVEGRISIDGSAFVILGVDIATAPRGGAAGIGNGARFGGAEDGGQANTGVVGFLMPPYSVLAAPEVAGRLSVGALNGALPGAAAEGGPLFAQVLPQAGVAARTLIMDIGAAQRLLDLPGMATSLIIDPDDRFFSDKASGDFLIEADGERLRYVDAADGVDAGRLSGSFHLNLTAFGLLAFFVGLLIVHSVIALSFEHRKGMFRAMRACGVTTLEAVAGFAVEVAAFALGAGTLGVALGFLVANAILPGVAMTLEGLYGEQVSRTLDVRPEWVVAGLVVCLAGALLAAAASLVRLARLGVTDIARRETSADRFMKAMHRSIALAAFVGAGGAAAGVAAGGLVGGFAAMGALLLAAALLLPAALAIIVDVSRRCATSPMTTWFWADARQQLPAMALALQALLIALSANIGVSTMVNGFRDTFVDWIDQRLAGDVFLRNDPTGEVRGWLAARGEVDRLLPFGFAEARLEGDPLRVLAFTDDETYTDHWPLVASLPDAWGRVARGEAALVNEQAYRRRELRLGDRISISTPSGELTLDIAGAYSDYGNPREEAMANVDWVRSHWPGFEADLFQVVMTEPTPGVPAPDPAALVAAARERFALSADDMIDQSALKAFSISIFERTFIVTDALSVLTLIVSGIALFTALSALSAARLSQLAPLWALGVRRGALASLDFLKTLTLAFLTALAAIPLGVFVAWMLVAVINVEAFGWRLPLYMYPLTWARLIAIAVAIAALASIPTFVMLRTASSATMLRTFASEK